MVKDVASLIEHTLLRADATASDLESLCQEAQQFGFYSVCIAPCHVSFVRSLLDQTSGKTRVTTVCGFPLGTNHRDVKAREAALAVQAGADEVDMVMRVGAACEGRWDIVERDIRVVREAVPGAVLKVIIETCYLDRAQKLRAASAVINAGADYVKTSTGFGTSGATKGDVALLKDASGGRVKIKAAGGIKTYEDALGMIEAGADLIGTSSGTKFRAC